MTAKLIKGREIREEILAEIKAEVDRIKDLYSGAARVTLDMGGFYSRPYGPVADMVYQRTADYTAELKKVKKLMDPNNIMSPGRLCF